MAFLRLFRRRRREAASGTTAPLQSTEATIARLRAQGATIGEGCLIYSTTFSSEPYLVTLGNRVAVSGGVKFLPHDGAVWLLRQRRPHAQVFGRIVVEDDCYIGENALLLPGTRIGRGSVVAAGAVVKGRFPENSVIAGNPARAVGRASLLAELMDQSPATLDSLHLPPEGRRALVERTIQP
jgi:acetyltransferase-like isoleucine patch superfamily enzyme